MGFFARRRSVSVNPVRKPGPPFAYPGPGSQNRAPRRKAKRSGTARSRNHRVLWNL